MSESIQLFSQSRYRQRRISLILGLAALNLATGALVSFFKLPVYLDSTGIVIASIVLGPIAGILCGIVTCAVGFFLINPYLPAYFGTSVVVALVASFCRRQDMFSTFWRSVASGLLIAVAAALASAPITAYLFGGATLSGVDAITAFFVSSGNALLQSVLYSGLASEPFDKVMVSLISFRVLASLPESFYLANGLRGYKESEAQ